MRFPTLLTAATVAILGAAACSDDDPTNAAPETGTVSAAMIDDPTPAPVAGGTAAQVQSAFSGTFEGETRVEIYSETEGWVEVAGTQTTQMDLGGSAQADLGSNAQVRAGIPYSRVRLTISGGEAIIDAGATLGGLVLLVDVSLDLGTSGSVTIEKDVTPFTVQADATSTLRIDLNSEMWVNESNATAETVTEAEMSAAAAVEVM